MTNSKEGKVKCSGKTKIGKSCPRWALPNNLGRCKIQHADVKEAKKQVKEVLEGSRVIIDAKIDKPPKLDEPLLIPLPDEEGSRLQRLWTKIMPPHKKR